jgi:hypothetical protein
LLHLTLPPSPCFCWLSSISIFSFTLHRVCGFERLDCGRKSQEYWGLVQWFFIFRKNSCVKFYLKLPNFKRLVTS